MSLTSNFLLGQLVLVAAIIGLIRLRKIQQEFYPFVLLLWLAVLTEWASQVCIKVFKISNAVPTNMYVLFESLIILYQFYRWGATERRKKIYNVLAALFVAAWIFDLLIWNSIKQFTPYFRILYAFIVVLISVNEINFMITHEKKNLFKNAKFLICLGFVIFFIYQILYEGAYFLIKLGSNSVATKKVTKLFSYVNAVANGLYVIAALLIPNKTLFKEKNNPFKDSR